MIWTVAETVKLQPPAPIALTRLESPVPVCRLGATTGASGHIFVIV